GKCEVRVCGRMAVRNSRSKETRKLRRLTKSEKRLLTIFGLAVFVMANFYGVSYLLDTENGLTQQLSELQATAKTNQIWLSEKQPPKVNLELEVARWYSPHA